MKMKFLFPALAAFFIFLLPACAQKNYGITKSYAYKKTFTPGNIMVDDQNNPVNGGLQVQHIVYLEVSGAGTPVVDEVIYNGDSYDSGVYPVVTLPEVVGKEKSTEKQILLPVGKGNTLWKIELTKKAGNNKLNPESKAVSILIKGKIDNKPFSVSITKETELAQDITY